jgi:2-hydroxychromene-2-carboxylate isomerase
MPAEIDYYFTASSPWVYLGHSAIREVAKRHDVKLNPRPVLLGGVWEASGSVPLAKRSPTRQRYRLVELQRYAELRGLPMVFKPKSGPIDATLPDLCVAAILLDGGDPLDFMARVFAAFWAEDRNIGEEAVVAALLTETGHDAATVIAKARSDDAAALRLRNTEAAIAADAIGVPAYVLNGEVFWGQDRIDLIDLALSTGRAPYKPL